MPVSRYESLAASSTEIRPFKVALYRRFRSLVTSAGFLSGATCLAAGNTSALSVEGTPSSLRFRPIGFTLTEFGQSKPILRITKQLLPPVFGLQFSGGGAGFMIARNCAPPPCVRSPVAGFAGLADTIRSRGNIKFFRILSWNPRKYFDSPGVTMAAAKPAKPAKPANPASEAIDAVDDPPWSGRPFASAAPACARPFSPARPGAASSARVMLLGENTKCASAPGSQELAQCASVVVAGEIDQPGHGGRREPRRRRPGTPAAGCRARRTGTPRPRPRPAPAPGTPVSKSTSRRRLRRLAFSSASFMACSTADPTSRHHILKRVLPSASRSSLSCGFPSRMV